MTALNFYRKTSLDWKSRNYVDLETQLVTVRPYADWESPWDFVCNDYKRGQNCRHAQDFCEMYNMIPPFCWNCWKVVVKPGKHSELIALLNLMCDMAEADNTVWCKCGIEVRNYVPGLYGGYFYTDSKEMGLRRLEQVRKLVSNDLMIDIPVYLKRACTEFENKLGDSEKWKLHKDAETLQNHFFSNMAEINKADQQPRIIKLQVHQWWIDFGWKFGSEEDRKEIEIGYNEGLPIHPQPRKYEE